MTMGEVYTPDCAADLGYARCGLDLAALEKSGSVAKYTLAESARSLAHAGYTTANWEAPE
jgi:hypothetical protein